MCGSRSDRLSEKRRQQQHGSSVDARSMTIPDIGLRFRISPSMSSTRSSLHASSARIPTSTIRSHSSTVRNLRLASICMLLRRRTSHPSQTCRRLHYRFRRSRRFFSASSQLRTCRRNASSTCGGQSGAVPKSGFSLLTSSISRFRFSIRVWMSSLMRTKCTRRSVVGTLKLQQDRRCLDSKFAESRIFNPSFPRLFPDASLPTEKPGCRS